MAMLAAILLCLACLIGAIMAVVGLPGIWFMALCALLMRLWRPDIMDWSVIWIALGLALAAEAAEFFAGAVGARQGGGSARAAAGALIGGILGALFGTVLIPIPLVGTVLGSAIGSGIGAVALELTLKPPPEAAPRGPGHIQRVGAAAFVGRLVATVIKAVFGMATGALISLAAVISAF